MLFHRRLKQTDEYNIRPSLQLQCWFSKMMTCHVAYHSVHYIMTNNLFTVALSDRYLVW